MALENRPINELTTILNAGGGMRTGAGHRNTEDLIVLARAASAGSCTLILMGLANRTKEDLTRIALAGSGHVIFDDRSE